MDPTARTRWVVFRDNPCEATFVPLYEATRRLVYTLCFRILRDEDDALDAFQAVYCRLLEAARRRETGCETPNEFHVAVGRLAIREADNLRKRRGRPARREIAMDSLPDTPGGLPAPNALAEQRLLRARIETLIDTLPERHRLVLQLHYFHGLSKSEIAGMLGKPASTVTRRIEAGLKRLKPLLQRAGIANAGSVLGGLAAVALLLDPPAKAAAAASVVYQASATALAASGGAVAGSASSASGAILSSAAAKGGLMGAPAVIGGIAAGAGIVIAALWFAIATNPATPPGPVVPSGGAPGAATVSSPAAPPAVPPSPDSGISESVEETAGGTKAGARSGDTASTDTISTTLLSVHVFWEDTKAPVGETTVTVKQASAETGALGEGNKNSSSKSNASAKPPSPLLIHTDTQGDAVLDVPASWSAATLDVLHPEAIETARLVSLPSASSPLEVPLRRGASVFGHVWIEGEGRPAAGAIVQADPDGKSARIAPDGTYSIAGLASKEVRLLATLGNYRSAPNNGARERMDLVPGQRNGPHDLVLRPGSVLIGRIVDDAVGKPLDDASVVLCPLYHINNMYRETVSVDGEGRYRVEGLAADSIPLAAEAPGYATSYTWVDVKAEEPTVCNFRLERGLPLDFQVVDPQGKPIPGVSFFQQIGGVFYPIEQVTDENGRERIEDVSSSVPPEFSLAKKGYSYNEQLTPTLDMTSQAFKPIRVVMSPNPASLTPGAFVGRVTDEKEHPIQGAVVQWVLQCNDQLPDGPKATTDAGGYYHLNIPPKDRGYGYVLVARAEGYAPAWRDVVLPGASDTPKEIDFALTPGHWIAGKVVDPEGNPLSNVTVSPVPENPGTAGSVMMYWWRLRTGTDGTFRFENIPGPRILLGARGSGWSGLSRRVDVDQEVQLVLQPKGEIHGRVVDGDTGDPIREFTLRVSGPDLEFTQATLGQKVSDPNGEFLLMNLDTTAGYTLTVDAEGYQPAGTDDVRTVPPESGSPPVEITLRRGESVQVQVVDSLTGEPVGGGEAVAVLFRKGESLDWSRLNEGDKGLLAVMERKRVPISSDGSFALEESSDKYTLFLLPAGHIRRRVLPEERGSFENGNGKLRISVEPGASVEGRVAIGGVPISSLKVTLQGSGKAWEILNGQIATLTDIDGRFHFDSLPASEYYGQVCYSTETNWFDFSFSLGPGEHKSLDLPTALNSYNLRGHIFDGQMPVRNADISLQPNFGSLLESFQAKAGVDGAFEIRGLPSGDYRVAFSLPSGSNSYTPFTVETIHIESDTAHDFTLARPHRILGSLHYPQEMDASEREKFVSVRIARTGIKAITGAEGEPEPAGLARIENGKFEIPGRFRGEYTLSLTYQLANGQNSEFRIGPPLHVDTFDGDQDLGFVAVPDLGAVRLRTTCEQEPEGDLSDFAAGLTRPGESQPAVFFSPLKRGEEVHTLSPVPVGEYDLTLFVPGYRADPAKTTVEVTLGTTPEVVVALHPVGQVNGRVMDADDRSLVLTIRSAALTTEDGNVLTARIIPVSLEGISTVNAALKRRESVAYQNIFCFPDLAGGTYQLAIDVHGFEPYHETVTVVPGTFEQPEPIRMKRKAP